MDEVLITGKKLINPSVRSEFKGNELFVIQVISLDEFQSTAKKIKYSVHPKPDNWIIISLILFQF